MEYKSKKKIDFKKWLLGDNSKIYAIILILSLAAIFVVVKVVTNVSWSSQDENASSQNEIDQTVTDSDDIAHNILYKIAVNKSGNYIIIYKKNESTNEFTTPYKGFYCSVNGNITTSVSKIESKYLWRKLADNCYGQYACRLSNSNVIHSVPTSTNNQNDIIIDAYNLVGKGNSSIGSIFLASSDAVWIYENCSVDTEVEIYDNATEKPAIEISPISQPVTTTAATTTQSKTTEATTTPQATTQETTTVEQTNPTTQQSSEVPTPQTTTQPATTTSVLPTTKRAN